MIKHMKIDGVVVLYHPTEENIQHIAEYACILNKFFVVDNSDEIDQEKLNPLRELNNIVYLSMDGNKGIAAALRIGVEHALEDGADFCLTMDQDSQFPVDRMEEIKTYLSIATIDDYGIIALNYGEQDVKEGLAEIDVFISSGNFINLKNYRLIQGFRDELFIDSVDYDLCHQFYIIGKKVAYIGEIGIKHRLGNPVHKKFLGIRPCTALNHSPIRCYYRYRNNYFLYHEDKKFYKEIRKADRKQFLKILLLEDNKREKIRMIRLGIMHAKQGKLGKLVLEPKKK